MRNMKSSLLSALPVAVLLVASIANVSFLFAQQTPPAQNANDPVVPITAHRVDLELVERFAKVLETKNRISRVDGFDPEVLEVSAVTPNRVRVRGKVQGVTSLVLYEETGANLTVDVFVKGDARTLQVIIDKKFPNSSIEAFKVQEAVALRGWVTHPEHITQIVEIAEQFYPKVLNQMRVGGVQQVLLKVKVMEAQRSKIRELGMNFTYLNRNSYINSAPGAITSLSEVTLGVPPSVVQNAGTLKNATASFAVIGPNNLFSTFMTALREEALLKILAEPEVLAINGRPATLLSGGEFPILVPQSLGTVSVQWREFGVRLEAIPSVLGGGSLRLELQPEVSERDFTNAVTISGTTVPGLTVRRVNTSVEMKFGQTLMLAGLISNRQSSTTSKIPFLGELPYVGAAFSRKRFDEAETEVVITVTPELVAPLDESQLPAGGPGRFTTAPTDRELMGYGLIEVPNYGDPCPNCAPGESGTYIVPGLKENQKTGPGSASSPASDKNSNQLILPVPEAGSEQSARSRRPAPNGARRSGDPSEVQAAGFADGASSGKSPTSRSRTNDAGQSNRATPSGSRQSASGKPAATSARPTNRSSPANSTGNRKPGLIEPSAR